MDRVQALRAAGAHAQEKFRTMQIECQGDACQNGVDKPEVDQWKWPANGPRFKE
jgi:xylulose-5-phosphate/fructose-6-phosphate phosphoketolase